MGCFGSKDKLSKEDMDFLKTHTRYDETTIKEWYKGFKVISARCRQTDIRLNVASLGKVISVGFLMNEKSRKAFGH